MWPFSRLRTTRFCAFCKAKRQVYNKKHVNLTNVVCAAAFTLAFTYAYFAEPDPRGLMVFCVFIISRKFSSTCAGEMELFVRCVALIRFFIKNRRKRRR